MRTPTAIALCLFAATVAIAQKPWQPPADHQQIPIWAGTPPDAIVTPGTEHTTWDPPEKGIAGKGGLPAPPQPQTAASTWKWINDWLGWKPKTA